MEFSGNKKSLPSLRVILFFSIGAALLVLTGGIIANYYFNMSNMHEIHEQQNIQQQGYIVEGAFIASTENSQPITRDWSSWDETYKFATGENDTFIDDHLSTNYPLLLHNFDFVAIKDLYGKDLYVSFYDVENEQPLSVPDGFSDLLTPIGNDIIKNYSFKPDYSLKEKLGKDGFFFSNGVCYYVCAMPILTSAEDEGPVGSFYFGRIINDAETNRLTNSENLSFTVLDLESPEIKNLDLDFSKNEVYTFTEKYTTYYRVLEDFYGNESLAFKVELPRDLYEDEMRVISFTINIFIIFVIIFVAMIIYLINRFVLRPLDNLTSDVQSITAETSSIDTSSYGINQEFHIMGSSINKMLDRLGQNRISMEESTVSVNVLKNILNGMDALLYVSDPQTDEILFINDRMKEQFGLGDDAVGSTCWKVLQSGFEKRCDFCPNDKLLADTDNHILWEEHNTATGRHYRNIDGIIEWTDGKMVHMQHSTDITDIKLVEASLQRRIEQHQLMSSISQSFITNNAVDISIYNSLEQAGEFMRISRVQLAQYNKDEGTLTCVNQWCKKTEDYQKTNTSSLPFKEGMPLFDILKKNEYAPLAVNDTYANDAFKNARAFDIKAMLLIPVFSEGELWGMLEFDNTECAYKWSKSDIHLGDLFSSLLSGVVSRQVMGERIVRMSSIIDSSPQYISYVNREGEFNFINPAAYEITGYSYDELMAGGMQLLFDDETNKLVSDEIIPAIFSNNKYDFEIPIVRKDGQVRILSFSGFTIEADEYGCGSIASDITEKKLLEQELISAKEMAEQSSKAKGEFLSRMSHEMRTPMNAIIGMTNIAKSSNDPDKKEYCLEKIDNASRHLLGVINDILDMSKIEANKFELSSGEFNFEKTLINITNIINYRADEKEQTLIVNVDKDVPVTMIGDEIRLSQVITNLLTNAIKFTPQGGTIMMNVNKTDECNGVSTLRIEVIDNGIGISEEQQSRLFKSFEQADGGISRQYGGTGLGLAISKKIVEMMDGTIWIDSELDKGAKFIFTVKIKEGQSKPISNFDTAINKDNLHILAVDDSLEIREYFLQIMSSLKLPCDVAAGGYEALEMIKNCKDKPYNIIFVDWMMPNLNGIELTKKIKQITDNNAVIIMISAADWSNMQKEANEAGINRFISKPLFPSVLLNAINEVMGISFKNKTVREKTIEYDFRNHTILLAEDVEVNREIIVALLENSKVTIDFAQNGEEALTLFKENPDKYSLILMDIHMPKMDGYEATQIIRSLDLAKAKSIPIIAMTANVFREDIEKCLEAGMNDHIGKPVDTTELFEKLNVNLPSKTASVEGDTTYKPIELDDNHQLKETLDYADLLPAVDVKDGLGRLMNNKKLYFTLLRNFAGRKMADEIIEGIENNDYSKTTQAAHALKGVSANLGLSELFKTAIAIEAQAKIGAEVVQFIPALDKVVNDTILAINTLLKSEGIK